MNKLGLVLLPKEQPSQLPSQYVREKIFFFDSDNAEADMASVRSIQMIFSEPFMNGVSFTYTSGVTRTIGNQCEEVQKMDLREGEELTHIEVGGISVGPEYISVSPLHSTCRQFSCHPQYTSPLSI
jgi:hypothetical protein